MGAIHAAKSDALAIGKLLDVSRSFVLRALKAKQHQLAPLRALHAAQHLSCSLKFSLKFEFNSHNPNGSSIHQLPWI